MLQLSSGKSNLCDAKPRGLGFRAQLTIKDAKSTQPELETEKFAFWGQNTRRMSNATQLNARRVGRATI